MNVSQVYTRMQNRPAASVGQRAVGKRHTVGHILDNSGRIDLEEVCSSDSRMDHSWPEII